MAEFSHPLLFEARAWGTP